MASRGETLGLVLTPALALGIAAAGLRLGATPPIVAAVVYGGAPPEGEETLVWQVFTAFDDGERQQGVALSDVTVVAERDGTKATWRGSTNADGVAFATLALPGVHAGDRIGLDVATSSQAAPLAKGEAAWSSAPPAKVEAAPFRGWASRDGEIGLDVAVAGHAVGTLSPATIWVRASDALTKATLSGVTLDASPVLSLDVQTPRAVTDARGWAHLAVRAKASGGGVSLSAKDALGRSGTWSGMLPIDPQVMPVDMPEMVPPGAPFSVGVDADRMTAAYAEVHDRAGIAAAAALDVSRGHAMFSVPPLATGIYWLVVTADPRGVPADSAPTARAFVVAPSEDVALALGPDSPACGASGEVGPCLACTAVARTARWVALDGFVARRAEDALTHRRARLVAFAALAAAGAIESALILVAFFRGRRRLRAAAATAPELSVARGNSVLLLALSLAVALLGFGLMAALVMR